MKSNCILFKNSIVIQLIYIIQTKQILKIIAQCNSNYSNSKKNLNLKKTIGVKI